MDWDRASNMIALLEALANGQSLEPVPGPYMLLGSMAVEKELVQLLCNIGYLGGEERTDEGVSFPGFQLSEKARRLIRVQEARRHCETGPPQHLWIVLVNRDADVFVDKSGAPPNLKDMVFIDKGEAPPNLKELVGEDWNEGDSMVVTCYDPRYVRAADLLEVMNNIGTKAQQRGMTPDILESILNGK